MIPHSERTCCVTKIVPPLPPGAVKKDATTAKKRPVAIEKFPL
jgi:hypothetical protein